ncbi:MAG: type II toxin-antitoxin system RelE/ParE family toxin [Chloroflexi bacterium]|nr:type II toxin-antitoxin system RelE/ParE family toxin [Chloroflexota bacterium]
MSDEGLWAVNYHRDLEKEIRRLPPQYIRRILETIEAFSMDPRPRGSKKIKGHDFWRMRVGIYRIIYQIDDEKRVVNTYRIAHRSNVYRNL